jgi:hypothetical protein
VAPLPEPEVVNWHNGGATSQTKYWRWAPQIAQQFGLNPNPQPVDSTLDPNKLYAQGMFPKGVPLAYSWQFGDVTNSSVSTGATPSAAFVASH